MLRLDGVVRISGTSNSDAVTTTVLTTISAIAVELNYVASLTLINVAAENFTDVGFAISNADQVNLIGCDIEGSGTTGIAFGAGVEGFFGTLLFTGFTGTNPWTGSPRSGELLQRGGPGAGNSSRRFAWGPQFEATGVTSTLATNATATILTPAAGEVWEIVVQAGDTSPHWRGLAYVTSDGVIPAVNTVYAVNVTVVVSGSDVQLQNTGIAQTLSWRGKRLK